MNHHQFPHKYHSSLWCCKMVSIIFQTLFVATSLCLACDLHYKMMTAQPGENVTLKCLFPKRFIDKNSFIFWFRHGAGHSPEFIAALNHMGSDTISQEGFNDTPRMTAKVEGRTFDLHINPTKLNDTAMYDCVKVYQQKKVEFKTGILLRIGDKYSNKGNCLQRSHYQTVLQQPESEPVHPGDSVTLQCSVLSESCTGQHSVFWFRAGAGESHPGLLYTQGDRSEECEKRPETPSPTQSCVYSLSKNNLSPSDSGTYYCAVATCGEILFGNGTRLDVKDKACVVVTHDFGETWIVISLCFALVICVIIITFLIYTIKRIKCDRRNTRGIQLQASVGETSDTQNEQRQDGDEMLYSQLEFTKRKALNRNRRHEHTNKEDTIYSDVKGLDVIDSL